MITLHPHKWLHLKQGTMKRLQATLLWSLVGTAGRPKQKDRELVTWGLQGSRQAQSCEGEKAMAPHYSTLAWKIPWMEERGALQSMGSLGVGHDITFTFHFHALRRKWQPTPAFLPGESQGRGSLVGCHLWGPTESDTTEVT